MSITKENELEMKVEEVKEMYIDFENMTNEQKLKFQGFYLAMQMFKENYKKDKEIA